MLDNENHSSLTPAFGPALPLGTMGPIDAHKRSAPGVCSVGQAGAGDSQPWEALGM